jgi:uncharacterized protein
VRLSLFPREESYFELFEAAAANVAESARLLLDMVEEFVEPEAKVQRVVEREHEGDRLTREILVRLNSTFVTPFDREDIFTLASQLDDVTDAIEEVAQMLVLHRVTEPIDSVRAQAKLLERAAAETADGIRYLRRLEREPLRRYTVALSELEDEGDRLYRHAHAELYGFTTEHPARFVLVWKDIIEQLEEAVDALEDVAHTVSSIVLKHA